MKGGLIDAIGPSAANPNGSNRLLTVGRQRTFTGQIIEGKQSQTVNREHPDGMGFKRCTYERAQRHTFAWTSTVLFLPLSQYKQASNCESMLWHNKHNAPYPMHPNSSQSFILGDNACETEHSTGPPLPPHRCKKMRSPLQHVP